MTMTTLETLTQRKHKIQGEIFCYKQDLLDIHAKIEKSKRDLKKVNEKIEALTAPAKVSDHAVLRYMERVLNIDVENIRQLILAESKNSVEYVQNGRVQKEDCTLIVADRTIVTILPA
jgi:hypothetical protein